MKAHWIISFTLLIAAPMMAEDLSQYGTTNPDEMTLGRVVSNAETGKVDMTTCAAGYMLTKSGRHSPARTVFEACANAGYTAAMTWMSYMDTNAFGGDYDPDRAAEWDRQAAEAGDPIGKFNYGIDLMRGHGVSMDHKLGRQWIDQAAQDGLKIAQRLVAADYDLDEITPDADNWRYAPLF